MAVDARRVISPTAAGSGNTSRPPNGRSGAAVITVDGLTKTFGTQRGVGDLHFDVMQGEVFGFLGPNGAGKSTTIRMLVGLCRPTAGTVTVFGRNPMDESVAIHRRIGYLPGDLALHTRLTGRQHIEFAAQVRKMHDRQGLDHLVERFDVSLDRPVRTLSKGNRQKIGLVLAFMHQPDLLILDEPTSGLDPLMQHEFQRLVRETVDDGRTVFLSSHELDEVQRIVDRVSIIKDGRIIVTDTVDGLRRTAPRTIEFHFPTPVDPRIFAAIDGVRVTSADGGRVTLALRGGVGPVLRAASALDPIDVVARPADLDELFLTYYRDDSPLEHGHAR